MSNEPAYLALKAMGVDERPARRALHRGDLVGAIVGDEDTDQARRFACLRDCFKVDV